MDDDDEMLKLMQEAIVEEEENAAQGLPEVVVAQIRAECMTTLTQKKGAFPVARLCFGISAAVFHTTFFGDATSDAQIADEFVLRVTSFISDPSSDANGDKPRAGVLAPQV